MPYPLNQEDFVTSVPGEIYVTPKSVGFSGRIYVLIDGRIYSSSENFVQFVKATKWATLVGTRTGGGTGRTPVVAVLPRSKLVIWFPISVIINYDGTINELTHTYPDVKAEPIKEEIVEDAGRHIRGELREIPLDLARDSWIRKVFEIEAFKNSNL